MRITVLRNSSCAGLAVKCVWVDQPVRTWQLPQMRIGMCPEFPDRGPVTVLPGCLRFNQASLRHAETALRPGTYPFSSNQGSQTGLGSTSTRLSDRPGTLSAVVFMNKPHKRLDSRYCCPFFSCPPTCCPSTRSLHGLPCRPSLSGSTLHGMQRGFDPA